MKKGKEEDGSHELRFIPIKDESLSLMSSALSQLAGMHCILNGDWEVSMRFNCTSIPLQWNSNVWRSKVQNRSLRRMDSKNATIGMLISTMNQYNCYLVGLPRDPAGVHQAILCRGKHQAIWRVTFSVLGNEACI